MSESTLVEAILALHAQIDFRWNFFVSVQLAIFALLLIYDEAVENLNIVLRGFAIVAIGLFDGLNGLGLVKAYHILDAALEQYRALYGKASRFEPAFYQYFVQAEFKDGPITIYFTHGMAFLVVALALIFRSFIQGKRRAQKAAPL